MCPRRDSKKMRNRTRFFPDEKLLTTIRTRQIDVLERLFVPDLTQLLRDWSNKLG